MFYDNYIRLCNSVNKSPSAVALEIGTTKATVSRWKTGSKPNYATAQKVADYFGVDVQDLLGVAEQKEPPAIQKDSGEHDETYQALLAFIAGSTQEERRELINYSEYIKSKRN